MSEKVEKGEKLYIVCDSSSEILPRSILRIYKSKAAAYRFLGKYVSELNRSTYTGFLSICEKTLGEADDVIIIGEA